MLATRWNSSVAKAVKDTFRQCEWYEWLFGQAPRNFWHDPENHRRYMDWLARQLGLRRPEDWYAVTNEDFVEHHGEAFLIRYRSTVSAAIMAHLPHYPWKEWLFSSTPKGFWKQR